jgi:hypothetical protein
MRLTIVLILISLHTLAGEPAPAGAPLAAPAWVGELPRKPINESSGLVKSRRHPDKNIFWTHNDSGDSERIFAVDGKGNLLRTVEIPSTKNVDWEEISMDDKGRLVICDVGDNQRKRSEITLYRLMEPDPLNAEEALREVQSFTYHYPKGQGPFDAEGVFVRGDSAWLFTKDTTTTRLFRLPLPVLTKEGEILEAELVLEANKFNVITGAAISDDGRHIALINYISISVLDLPCEFEKLEDKKKLFENPSRTRLALLGQTEAVAWDSADLVLTTEGGAMYRVHDAIQKKEKVP